MPVNLCHHMSRRATVLGVCQYITLPGESTSQGNTDSSRGVGLDAGQLYAEVAAGKNILTPACDS